MTCLALLRTELTVGCATDTAVTPTPPMRVKGQIGAIEGVMAVDAGLIFMAAVTALRISAGGQGMGHGKFAAMDIGQRVTEASLFIGKSGLVAIKT